MTIAAERVVAIVGVFSAGFFITVAHLRRPELRATEVALSVYFTDGTRTIMIAAYAAIMAALLSAALMLADSFSYLSMVAAMACGFGAVLLVPVAATTQRKVAVARSDGARRVHRYAAAAAFAAVGVAMFVSGCTAAVESNMIVAIPGLVGSALVVRVLRPGQRSSYGMQQKLLLFVVGLWIAVIAFAT